MPKPGANEVQIKIHAASMNRRDVAVMQGNYPMPPRGQIVPLSDGAGVVSAVGPGVTRFKVGDKVVPIFFPNWIKAAPPATPRKCHSAAPSMACSRNTWC